MNTYYNQQNYKMCQKYCVKIIENIEHCNLPCFYTYKQSFQSNFAINKSNIIQQMHNAINLKSNKNEEINILAIAYYNLGMILFEKRSQKIKYVTKSVQYLKKIPANKENLKVNVEKQEVIIFSNT